MPYPRPALGWLPGTAVATCTLSGSNRSLQISETSFSHHSSSLPHHFLLSSFDKGLFFLQICLVCADTGKTTSVFRDNQIHSSMLKHNHVHNYLSLPRSGKCERWRGRLHSLCSLSVTNVDNSQTLNKLGLEWCYSYPQPLLYSFVNETHIVKLDWLEWSCMMISTMVEPYSNGHSCLLLHFQ